ncbi:MAG: hypothetical protein JWQ87_5515 [Candidatus Sulfotelmatobacter sp.]|nr:hypothetical protein [Candidatus Sulfotelmatobacter sp.]
MSGGGVIHDIGQADRILNLLLANQANGDGWTSAVDIAQISLQYCRAINGLRKQGIKIENPLEVSNGKRRGYYRLLRPEVSQSALFSPRKLSPVWADPEEAR